MTNTTEDFVYDPTSIMFDENGLKREFSEVVFRKDTLQPRDVIGKVANSIFDMGDIYNRIYGEVNIENESHHESNQFTTAVSP